jgi:hypothetical protein
MTKKVRNENADSGQMFQVVVETWNKSYDANGPIEGSDKKTSEQILRYPADMWDFYLSTGQYFIVKEINSGSLS